MPRSVLAAMGGALGVMVIITMGCTNERPAAAIPDTPAGHAFRVWIDAYNAADSARLDAYVREYEPAMSVHTQLVFRFQTGPYAVLSVERSEPRHLEVQLQSQPDAGSAYHELTTYAALDLSDSLPVRATTTFWTIHRGAATSTLGALARRSRTSLPKVSASQRKAAVDSLIAKIGRNYVRGDVARRMSDSLRARSRRRAYDEYETAPAFAVRLNTDLRELAHDAQLTVEYAYEVPLTPIPTPPQLLQCGVEPATIDNGVGLVTLYSFGDWIPTCSQEVSRAMDTVASARALIVDLREAADESRSAMAFVASYLTGSCTHLGDSWNRRTGTVEPLYTHDGLPGARIGGGKPLVILTSAHTVGAAEELVYDLRAIGRATVVGERTAGRAYETALGQIGEHLLVRVPTARAINPITKTNWQDVGIEPDVKVSASDALSTARQLLAEGRVARGREPPGTVPAAGVSRSMKDVAPPPRLRGVRFAIDTLASSAEAPGALSRVAGVAEFANGRGRIDVTAIRHARVMSFAGVLVGEPLAKPGDYYLFDNAGFVLVHPASRTYSSFRFTRADYNHTGALLPGAFMFGGEQIGVDTLGVGARTVREHAPLSVHWHMQPPDFARTGMLYARGWLEVADAPAIEAGVARWFEVAAALATRPGGVNAVARGGLEVTSVVLLRHLGARRHAYTYAEMLYPRDLREDDIDPQRLVLPAGYAEVSSPGSNSSGKDAGSGAVSARWLALEDTTSQRSRSVCGQAWLPARDN